MGKIALVAGSTGLIGELLVRKLVEDEDFSEVITLARRQSAVTHPKLRTAIVDFHALESTSAITQATVAFCCLGTTMKKAGSKDAFYQVDFTFVKNFAQYAKGLGCQQFQLVSAMGADAKSMFYYNQVKGQIEAEIKKIGFDSLHIMQPSLLLGNRQEARLGENLGKLLATTFDFLIPKNYKGIQAETVANFMLTQSKNNQSGVFVHPSGEIISTA